ncbi:hypothetical protein CEP51_009797 [Fusarium floridanum]|uniref:Uncharacterized protein n=1 Tax=Fusarium floridanum TaxID=1325733 RepID=A0A428RGI0_9HYPO|nr:hypothetical protein CEP51_009797 [Fusarium floridanum]
MAQEAPNPLPFSESTHTTLAAATQTRQLLADQLLPELARPITSFSYNPWITKRRDDMQEYEAEAMVWGDLQDYSTAALYLHTEPMPTGLKMFTAKRIIFQTRAADQGWATFGGEGTFENSHTWFDASILRPLDTCNNGENSALGANLRCTLWDTPRARDEIREHGWEFVEGEDGQIKWRVCNNLTAISEYRNYKVEWEKGVVSEDLDEMAVGTGEGFLELLGPGCIVVLWARAEQAHWVNKVEAVTVEIEYDFL